MADLLDLIKAGALIFSRDPMRTITNVDAIRETQQNRRAVDSLFGPAQSGPANNPITWNTPRQTPGISPQLQSVINNPMVMKLLEAPQFRQQMAGVMLGDALPKVPEAVQYAPGTSYGTRDPRTGVSTITGTAPFAPQKADLVTVKMPDGTVKSFDTATQQSAITSALAGGATEVKTPSTVVNNQFPGAERAYDVEFGKINANAYADILKAGAAAIQEAPKIDRLGDLLSQIKTGAFKGTTTDLKAKAKALGVDLEALGIRDDVGIAEAAQALSKDEALRLRNPAGGAGMPGAMSDGDREYLSLMAAGVDKQTTTNEMLIDARRKLNRRSRDVASLANKYTKEHGGRFDQAGFQDYLAEWSDKNPLFESAKGEPAAQSEPDYTKLPPGSKVNQDGSVIGPNGKPLVWKP